MSTHFAPKRCFEIQVSVAEFSLGQILIAHSARGICAVLLGDDSRALRKDLQERFPEAILRDAGVWREAIVAQVIRFVESPEHCLDAILDMRGTEFQCQVWQALRSIAVGSTASYTDIARQIGMTKAAARAVAQACAANPLAIVVPCHRVLRSDGSLSGYRWGVDRKRKLLEREAAMLKAPSPSPCAQNAAHQIQPA